MAPNIKKALWQTSAIMAFIAFCWCWLFRSEHSSFHSLRDAWRYHGLVEGFRLWLTALNVGPGLLLGCFALPGPMIKLWDRQRKILIFLAGFGYLLFLTWTIDYCHDGNSWRSWFGWASLFRLMLLSMPISAVGLGCLAIQAGDNLREAMRLSESRRRPSLSAGWILWTIAGTGINLGCVFAGVFASRWLKAHTLGPFFNGMWDVLLLFLNPPTSLHRILASDIGGFAAMAWGLAISLVAASLPIYTRQIRDCSNGFVIGFAISGYVALWAAGDVLCNYYGLPLP